MVTLCLLQIWSYCVYSLCITEMSGELLLICIQPATQWDEKRSKNKVIWAQQKRLECNLQGTLRVSVSSRSLQRQNKCFFFLYWGGCGFYLMCSESVFLGKITFIKQKSKLFWPPLRDFQWAECNIRWVEDITASSGLLLKRAHSHYGLRRKKQSAGEEISFWRTNSLKIAE